MIATSNPESAGVLSVPMGRWGVAAAPILLRTLLGSCVGIIIHDPASRLGGVAHIVLPESNGQSDHPGKFADTAIPGMIDELDRLRGRRLVRGLSAKIVGGASMFQAAEPMNIGRRNAESVEKILAGLGIPVLARDLGGSAGRRLTFDIATGMVTIRIPGGADYAI